MLMNNKKFHESKKDLSSETASACENEEKLFESLGFELEEFPKNFMKFDFPTYIMYMEVITKRFKFYDTTIVIDDEYFHCHFIVLKCYSKYLANLDQPDINLSSIVLPSNQVSSLAFCEIYEWMLLDNKPIKRSSFAEVYKAAIFLKIEQLIEQIIEIIDDETIIDERCALSIFLEARKIDFKNLQSFMVRKISRIFLTFVASQEFFDCSLFEITEFFKSNRIAVNSELDMVFVAIRWLSYQWPKRKIYVQKLVECIKLESIDSHQLVEINKCSEHLQEIFKPIQKAVDATLSVQISKRNRLSHGDGNHNDHSTLLYPRMYMIDPLWQEENVEKNFDFHETYARFQKYLKKINACHWIKIRYRDEILAAIDSERSN
ncbi:hypothetical protein PVAND_012021 [Polypedilum vanderplanki]|uniref:BACK domain-containing protein n=1 Tax=Polypedilum vanderplanki TaxID=319348 RepID=A0A9J6CM55_POLVA|nr:hypothetical protein PVAND_012021 [Polypedilum vanderplanki]